AVIAHGAAADPADAEAGFALHSARAGSTSGRQLVDARRSVAVVAARAVGAVAGRRPAGAAHRATAGHTGVEPAGLRCVVATAAGTRVRDERVAGALRDAVVACGRAANTADAREARQARNTPAAGPACARSALARIVRG